jgi:hypothetical protein
MIIIYGGRFPAVPPLVEATMLPLNPVNGRMPGALLKEFKLPLTDPFELLLRAGFHHPGSL